MTYALIGCGRIATNHIKAALESNLEISAVCDLIPERMETLLTKHGLKNSGIRRFTNYHTLLQKEKPELVAIATESGSHAVIALDCLDAGAHLIIEKPIALSLSDADKVLAKAKEKSRLLCACHQNRFNEAVQYMRSALEQGRFGRLSHGTVHVRWNRGKEYYDQAPWRGTWAQDGGCLMNQSIHGIDLLRWMMGDEITEVFAYTSQRFHSYLECEDVGLAVVRFASGALGSIEGTVNVFPQNLEETLYLFGECGTVKIGGKSCNRLDTWTFSETQPEDLSLSAGLDEAVNNVYGNGHISLYADMADAIRTGRTPYVDGAAGRRALELVLAIYMSQQSGAAVKLPLSDVSTLNFIGR